MDLNQVIAMLRAVLATLIPGLKKADSTVGVTETKEAFRAVNAIAVLVAERMKDGLQVGEDFAAVFDKMVNDEEFKTVVGDGWDKMDQIPAEFQNIDIGEGLELADEVVGYVPQWLEALKKVEVPTEVEVPVEPTDPA